MTFHETGNLFRAFFGRKISVWEFMSVLTHMYNGSVYALLLLQSICSLLLCLIDPTKELFHFSPEGLVYSLAVFTYSFFFLFYYADWVDNGIRFSIRSLPVTIAAYVINIFIGFISQIYGLIHCRDQQHWAKTEHGIDAHAVHESHGTAQLRRKAA